MEDVWVPLLAALIGGAATIVAAIYATHRGHPGPGGASPESVGERVVAPVRQAAQSEKVRTGCTVSVTVGLVLACLVGAGTAVRNLNMPADDDDEEPTFVGAPTRPPVGPATRRTVARPTALAAEPVATPNAATPVSWRASNPSPTAKRRRAAAQCSRRSRARSTICPTRCRLTPSSAPTSA